MAYTRWGENSEVYLYQTSNGIQVQMVCCMCLFKPLREDRAGCEYRDNWMSSEIRDVPRLYDEAAKHLSEHLAAGHRLDNAAFDRLKQDRQEIHARHTTKN